MRCTIIANGEFCKHEIPLATLKKSDYTIACDGAYNNLFKIGFIPNIIIGDCDSLKSIPNNIQTLCYKNQSTNDLTKAFKFALSLNCDEIYILGAGGLRDDHFIANFALLNLFGKLKNKNKTYPKIIMQTNYGEFKVFNNSFKLNTYKGQQVSLFCFDKSVSFKSINLKYPLNNFKFKNLFSGTLNESINESIEIIFSKPTIFITYLNY